MTTENTTPLWLPPRLETSHQTMISEKSLKTINKLSKRTERHAKSINLDNATERIWLAIDRSADEIHPPKIEEYALEFEANPQFERNKPRVQDMIKWCSAAEKFYESQAKLATFVLNRYKTEIRATREKMERVIADTDAREVLYNTIYVHLDTQIIAHINRLPHDMVAVIGQYLPKDIVFAVHLPSVEEMEATLSKVTLPKLKKFIEYIQHRNWESDGPNPTDIRRKIGSIECKAQTDKVIASCYNHPQTFNWGFDRPKNKGEYVTTIVGYVRVYEYHANIFKTAATKPYFQMQNEYKQYATVLQDEAVHIVKFMRFLANQKKVRRPRVVS